MTTAPSAWVVPATVTHRRSRPFPYAVRHRTTSWLVDTRDPLAPFPRWLRRWASIRSADHLGSLDADLHTKVRHLLDEQGLGWTAHTVRVLAGARTAGYVFDPLTTYFCFGPDGELEGILAEVHNTYGERHCYPMAAERAPASASGASGASTGLAVAPTAARVDSAVPKQFYVSPFFAVEGRYDVRARLTDTEVAVTITLTQGDERVFAGSVRGPLVVATRGAVLRALLRDPFAAQRVALLIRWHGIRLWLRRLPVVPRRPHRAPRGMA